MSDKEPSVTAFSQMKNMLTFLLAALSVAGPNSPARTVAEHGQNVEQAAKIRELLWTVLTTDDDAADASAKAEMRKIFEHGGLPTVAEVGDEAAYEFIVLAFIQGPTDFRARVLAEARQAAARNAIPADALTFLEVRTRGEPRKAVERGRAPRDPELRDRILHLAQTDQEVRKCEGFELAKMESIDKQNEQPLRDIIDQYGVPNISMVGAEAAGAFVLLVQHQSAEFRQRVLPGLKTNVESGEADAEGYALVYDRLARDQGRKQKYGTQLECDAQRKMVEAPIEDSNGVNQRRAELGMLRVALYERLIQETQPNTCPPAGAKP